MNEPRVSDQDLSDLRHSNRHDSPVCAFIGRDATSKRINMNQVCDDLIDCRSRCAALAAEVESFAHALGLLTTLHPAMEMDATNPVGMARQIVDHLKADRRALVEAAVRAGREAGQDESSEYPGPMPDTTEAIAARALAEFEARK